MVKTRRVGRQRLWTLISLAPIAVLCGVLVYGYGVRPRLALRKASDGSRVLGVWDREAGRIRPWLLDFLSEEQRTEVEENKAKYEADLQDLPKEIQREIKRVVEADRASLGRPLVGGKVGYVPTGRGDGAISVGGEFRLKDKVGIGTWNTNFPIVAEAGWRRRAKPRPKIMRRTATVIADRTVSLGEFNAWWEWTEAAIAPLAGPRQQDSEGQVVAYIRYGSLGASELARVRDYFEYLLKVLPRPEPSEPVALGEVRDAGANVSYTGLGPNDRVRRVTLMGTLSAVKGAPASGSLRYSCEGAGGLFWFSWEPDQDGVKVSLMVQREKWL